jgi:hypothetical protein
MSLSRNRTQLATEDYDDLHQYSVENWDFWKDLWEFGGIIYSVPPNKVRLTYVFGFLSPYRP